VSQPIQDTVSVDPEPLIKRKKKEPETEWA
jgi:hypothetical protein